VLFSLFTQWFPSECRAAGLKSKGNNLMEIHKFEKAILLYSEAIELGKFSYITTCDGLY
jgi:hypothetical protein